MSNNFKNKISIVIGSYNRLPLLKETVRGVRRELPLEEREIIIVDGGSNDGTLSWLSKQKDIITIIQYNRGTFNGKKIARRSWGYFMNLGFKCAQGKYICMLSDDSLLVPGAIRNGVTTAEAAQVRGEKVGAVAFYWRDITEPRYYVNSTLGGKMYVNHGLYLNEAMQAVNYVEEEALDFYFGDGDLCLKMWNAGYSCIDSPNSYVEHCPHTNVVLRKENSKDQSVYYKKYVERWRGKFEDMPAKQITRDFSDPTQTAQIFNRLWYVRRQRIINTLGFKVKSLLRKLKILKNE